MANERQRACASFRSDAFPDFRFCRYYDYVDNNTVPILERSFRSASLPTFWREALSDDDEFLRRVCDIWFAILRRSQQLAVVSVIIVAVTVCDLRTRILPIYHPSSSSSFNGINNTRPRRSSISNNSKQMKTMRAIRSEDRGATTRQAIIYNNRSGWTALNSLGQFLHNQQMLNHVVVVVQCNQHHRERRHRGRTLFSIIPLVYKIIANNSYIYLLSVVDSKQHTVGIARIVHSKKILVECFIFAYLISLDLYS